MGAFVGNPVRPRSTRGRISGRRQGGPAPLRPCAGRVGVGSPVPPCSQLASCWAIPLHQGCRLLGVPKDCLPHTFHMSHVPGDVVRAMRARDVRVRFGPAPGADQERLVVQPCLRVLRLIEPGIFRRGGLSARRFLSVSDAGWGPRQYPSLLRYRGVKEASSQRRAAGTWGKSAQRPPMQGVHGLGTRPGLQLLRRGCSARAA